MSLVHAPVDRGHDDRRVVAISSIVAGCSLARREPIDLLLSASVVVDIHLVRSRPVLYSLQLVGRRCCPCPGPCLNITGRGRR